MAEDPEIVELEPSNEGEGKEYAPRLELEPPKDKVTSSCSFTIHNFVERKR
jgi:hypothetical protein